MNATCARQCRLPGQHLAETTDSCGSRLCENAAKTITRRHDGLQWLLIGQGDQQGVHGGDMREYGRL